MKTFKDYGFKPDETIGTTGGYILEEGPFRFHLSVCYTGPVLTCSVWVKTDSIAITQEMLAKDELPGILKSMKSAIRRAIEENQ